MGKFQPPPPQNIDLDEFCIKAVQCSVKDADFVCPVCGAMLLRAMQRHSMTPWGTEWLKRDELAKHIRFRHWKSENLDQYYYAMVLGSE